LHHLPGQILLDHGPRTTGHLTRDLQFLNELIEAGKVKPVIDRTYPLDAAPDAVRYFESGRATGRIALVV